MELSDIMQKTLDDSIEQISAGDATFLYAESPTSPMHVGSVIIVEGSLKYSDFKKMVAARLHLIPKFRKRLFNVPLNLDYPYWVDDPNFDLDLQLNRIKLPDPSNWKTLREITASIYSAPLDLRRPLWSINFIEGLNDIPQIPKGSVAILTKVHHVMIDGNSGVGILQTLFDKDEKCKDVEPKPPKPYDPEPLPDDLTLLLKSSLSFFKNPFKVPKLLSETVLSVAKSRIANQINPKKDIFKSSFSVPKTIFNESVSAKRTWGTAILSFDRINALRKIMEVSINDVILAICAGAIRMYLFEKDKLPAQPLVANVPISIRTKDSNKLDNQISNMLVQIGTHIENPIKRLEFIQEQTNIGKTKHKTVGAKSLSEMANSVPFGLANLAAGIYSKYNIKDLHRPPFNVTITNVPGPKGLLYLKGHKVVTTFGLAPVLDGFGLIIAAFSYNGQVTITTTSDSNTMPDIGLFSKYIRKSANELEEVVKKNGKRKKTSKTLKYQSAAFFNAFKKYVKNNPNIHKKYKGIYEFQVDLNNKQGYWQMDFTKKDAIIKKIKPKKSNLKIEIDDENLYKLYKGKLLLDELEIQDRIHIKGAAGFKSKFSKFITEFLER